jgi:magnesium-transporting ATPase (P-type)
MVGRVKAIAFDKTGTLTTGQLQVVGLHPAAGYSEAELLQLAASVESVSEHPIGMAIALFNVLLLAIGHVLAAGYAKQFQASVAISAIARNLGLAIFIATSLARADAVLTIVAAQIIGIIVNLPYTRWIKHR